ncbi:MAG: DUF255 domain-containing protein [Akkermansiaceae bacterium]
MTALWVTASIFVCGCRSKNNEIDESENLYSWAAEYEKAPLTTGQSSMLDSQVDSPVQWQSWHKDLFRHANNERKTVCALIGSGTDIDALRILQQIDSSPSLAGLLQKNHINTLIDSNLHPDMARYAAVTCIDSNTPVGSTALIWFSYDGDPISWHSIQTKPGASIESSIQRMSSTVQHLWMESPEYTLEHSSNHPSSVSSTVFPKVDISKRGSLAPIASPILRNKSLFDPVSNTVDNIFNLAPTGYLELMVSASRLPELSPVERQKCLDIARKVADKRFLHGLIDPLDGGVFNGNQGMTDALPVFSKTLRTQALSMRALYKLYRATKDKAYLNAANSIFAYSQKYHLMDDGSYAIGISYLPEDPQDQPCLFTLDEIKAALSPEEYDIATQAYGLRSLGNIPLIDDSKKVYFKKNSLSWKLPLAELSKRTGMGRAPLTKSLANIATKLTTLRSQKPVQPIIEKLSTASATALYSSACTSGYRATGETSYLEAGKKTLSQIRDQFVNESGTLHRARYGNTLLETPAKGIDYTRVCQAALDLHEATLDPAWLDFAHAMHKQMLERLGILETGTIKEHDGTGYPKDYPACSYYTINGLDIENTCALAHSNARRLAMRLGDSSLSQHAEQLGVLMAQTARMSPTAAIDYLSLESEARSQIVYIKLPASEPMLAIARREPCHIIAVTQGGSYPQLGNAVSEMPAGSCIVTTGGKISGAASKPAELEALLKQ